jgi:DNA-binding winged helix-turn-helix (wHTH) protein
VLLLDVPDPVGARWARALHAAGHAVVRIDGPTPPGAIRGDVVVIGREVPLDTEDGAIVARVRPARADRLRLAAGRLDLADRTFHHLDGRAIPLTDHEAGLLRVLADARGEPVERERLLREVWGHAVAVVTRSVDNTVARLRAKIEHDPAAPDHLLTARGAGYRLVGADPVEAVTEPILGAVARPPADLVGRDALLSHVRQLLDAGPGLVTLVGAPGVGKSAVALAALADRAAVTPAGGPASAPPPGVVLLLDDVDDGLAAAAQVVPSLVARGARILAATRAPLGVAEERCVRVPPLDPGAARRLLAFRAGREDPAWDEVAPRLGGFPLALELAAHAARLLGGRGLRERLDDPLAVLAAPHRRPERHRSWLDAVGASWARLAPPERTAAAWAASRDTFTLAEAEAALGSWRPIALLQERSLVEQGPVMAPLVRAAIRRLAELRP